MKYKLLMLILAAGVLFAGCDKEDPRYDAPDGVNREMTLFSEEFTLPLGSIAPLTLQDAMNRIGVLAGLINRDDEGYLILSGENKIASWSVWDLDIEDKSQPYVFEPDAEAVGLPLVPMMLGLFGFHLPDQSYVFTVKNPLEAAFPLTAHIAVGDYFETFRELRFKETEIAPGESEFAEISLPGILESEPTTVSLDEVRIYLPADVWDTVSDLKNPDFVFSYRFKSRIGLADYLDFPFEYTLTSLQLPLSRYKLREVTVNLEVESTLPVEATVEQIHVVDQEGNVDGNVSFTENVTINGGSLKNPVTTPISLTVKAESGTLPDIGSLALELRFGAASGVSGEPISSAQGIAIKNSSITLRGGITFSGK